MLRELQTLLAVAQHGTFAAAGERIGLTQGAVSAQIQRLEEELGFPLFDRTGRSATLNAAGRETLARAQEIVSLCRQPVRPGAAQGKGRDPHGVRLRLRRAPGSARRWRRSGASSPSCRCA